jgi:hypothetical protein
MSNIDSNDLTANLADAANDATAKASDAVGKLTAFDPIQVAHDLGIRSRHAYVGGFVSIVVALATWSISRAKPSDSKGQSDRWGIFIGHWAPTFFAIGLALKSKERN